MNTSELVSAAASSVTTPDLSTTDYVREVRARALGLVQLSHDRVFEVISRAYSRADEDKDFKMFTGTIQDVEKEESSTRALITLETRKSTHNPDGMEQVRTERTDSSEVARDLANAFYEAIGHRVLLFVEVQKTNDGRKVRVVQHFVDLEPDIEG